MRPAHTSRLAVLSVFLLYEHLWAFSAESNPRRQRRRQRQQEQPYYDQYNEVRPLDESPIPFQDDLDRSLPMKPQFGRRSEDWWDDEDDDGADFSSSYDEYDDIDASEDDIEPAGNFWYNPKASFDDESRIASSSPGTPRRRRRAESEAPKQQRRRPPTRTTFRSGNPAPPNAMTDLYNRLFWYGFDPADTATSPADPTMFGGTKGKFNGLAYLNDDVGITPGNRRSSRPKRKREEYWDGDVDVNDDIDERIVQGRPSLKPPFDAPRPMPSKPFQISKDDGDYDRQQAARYRKPRNDWVSEEVSTWFDDEKYQASDGYSSRRSQRQRRDRSSPAWLNPFGALDAFFGVDDSLKSRAEEYDRQMGIGRPRRQSSPRRRKGYAYRYENDDDDDAAPLVEYEVVPELVEPVQDVTREEKILDAPLTDTIEAAQIAVDEPSESIENGSTRSKKPELTWEERALAIERVPPANIPAWGPSGDLGIDARTKAISDALEDINDARRIVEEKKKLVDQARENVSILGIDAELERKRLNKLQQSTSDARRRLRRIELDMQDASRALRYAQSRLRLSEELLAELENRHWAVLSFYNPSQAEEVVNEALRELEEAEPAVRRFRDKTENGSTDE